MAVLELVPQSCMHDEKVNIRVRYLPKLKPYTLVAHMQDTRPKTFFSYSHYVSDESGVIDVSLHESIGGDYTGVFQMGLISALHSAPHQEKHLRLFKRDLQTPSKIDICVYEGHINPDEIFIGTDLRKPMLHHLHFRHYMAHGVKRIPINEGRVRASLFLPKGTGPFPGIIDLFGTAGGLIEFRAAQLASRGVASLALAYMDYEDLTKDLLEIDIKYFEEAVNILLARPEVMKPCVGVLGVSKGGDIALCMAAFIPQIKFAIAINAPSSVFMWPLKVSDDLIIPSIPYDSSKVEPVNKEYLIFRNMSNDPRDHPESFIPIHNSNASYLFIVGEDDVNLNSMSFALHAKEKMEMANKAGNIQIWSYAGAGHLIEPPYSSFCYASYHKSLEMVVAWGGNLKEHTAAQVDVWPRIIRFITEKLMTEKAKL